MKINQIISEDNTVDLEDKWTNFTSSIKNRLGVGIRGAIDGYTQAQSKRREQQSAQEKIKASAKAIVKQRMADTINILTDGFIDVDQFAQDGLENFGGGSVFGWDFSGEEGDWIDMYKEIATKINNEIRKRMVA